MENAAAASNQMSSVEMAKFVMKGSSSKDDFKDSAFDGQVARLGGFHALKTAIEAETGGKDDQKAGQGENEDDVSGSDAGGTRKKQKLKATTDNNNEETTWFERETKVAEAVRGQKIWLAKCRNDFEASHEALRELVNKATSDGQSMYVRGRGSNLRWTHIVMEFDSGKSIFSVFMMPKVSGFVYGGLRRFLISNTTPTVFFMAKLGICLRRPPVVFDFPPPPWKNITPANNP